MIKRQHGGGKSRRAQERERYDTRGRDRTGEVNDEQDPDGPKVVKLRGKKRNYVAAGQRDLFASPDLFGEQRKQQIVQNQRVLVKHVETGTIRVGTDTLKDVRDVGHFIAPIRKLAQEEMYAIVLDANDKVINVIKHSKGQKSQATVSTWTLAGAVVATPEAKSVWFAHNHPSGEATPSWADQGITWHLNDVLDGSGVVNNGHVVVSKGSSFHTMDADGQMLGAFQAEALPRKQTVAVTERQLRKNNPKFQVSSPDTAKPILDAISPNALVLLNTQHKITGILPLSDSDLSTLRFPGDPAEANRIIAEEYLAHLAEKDPQNGLLSKIVSMIRNALRRLFPNIKWTDTDAVELLAAARRKLKRDGGFNPKESKGHRYHDGGLAPTFYSAVERSAAAVKSDKLPAQSWLNAIKKGNNVQDEEIQWLGLDLWLADKKSEKLSKSEVLDFIRGMRCGLTKA